MGLFNRRADDKRMTSNRTAHFVDGIVGGGDAFASSKPKSDGQISVNVGRAQEAQWGGHQTDQRAAKAPY